MAYHIRCRPDAAAAVVDTVSPGLCIRNKYPFNGPGNGISTALVKGGINFCSNVEGLKWATILKSDRSKCS